MKYFENWKVFLKEGALSDEFGKERAARVRKAMYGSSPVPPMYRTGEPPQPEYQREDPSDMSPEEYQDFVRRMGFDPAAASETGGKPTGVARSPHQYNEIVQHNVKQLRELEPKEHGYNIFKHLAIEGDETTRKAYEKEANKHSYTGGDPSINTHELVSRIPPLARSKIVKLIGAGTKKFAYLLDNDHILSLFQSGYQEYDDLEWYAGIQKRQFAGESSVDEPSVTDYGDVKFNDVAFYPEPRWNTFSIMKYVEMSGVIPLEDALPVQLGAVSDKNLDRYMRALDTEITAMVDYIADALKVNPINTGLGFSRQPVRAKDGRVLALKELNAEEQLAQLQFWWLNRGQIPWLKQASEEPHEFDYRESGRYKYKSYGERNWGINVLNKAGLAMNLLKTLVRLVYRRDVKALMDLHPGNLGMSKENPDEFVVFDI